MTTDINPSDEKGIRKIAAYIKYPFYTMVHPAEGFYGLRHEKKGSIWMIIGLIFMLWLSFAINSQYAGLVVDDSHPMDTNSLVLLAGIISVFILFCAANWSVTCLMDGEGRLIDIAMATSYAMIPIILTMIPATILSNFLIMDEAAFYYMILSISIVWFVVLLVVGIMTIHDYTVLKTLITIFLTFVSMAVILFMIMLLTSMLQNIYIFFHSLYIEIVL